MHKSASSRRKGFGLAAAFAASVAGLGALAALLAGVTPAMAADLASQPDTQVAIFMVPLTLLVLVLLFEAARYVWRGKLPATAPRGRPRRTNWAPGPRAG